MTADLLAPMAAYIDAVQSGERLACEEERLAVARHLADLDRAASDPDYPYTWDADRAARAVRFIQLLPHIKGEWAGSLIRLEGWQQFVVASLFGWVKADGLRRFRLAYVKVPRKNAKSTLAAGIGLYMLTADGEPGAEVYSGATSEKQALEVFRPAREMARKLPQLRQAFGLEVAVKALVTRDGSRFEPVIGKPGDGASPHCAIVDEYHEHDSDDLWDTMVTGMGARRQPLALAITTAGSDIAGPCYQMELDAAKVLRGVLDQPDLFAVMYGLDKDDDWTRDESLRKANPNYGVSVKAEFLRSRQQEAMQSPRKAATFLTKHCNRWVSGRDAWMNMLTWSARESALPDGQADHATLALDLSSKIDLSAAVRCYRYRSADGAAEYHLRARFYAPADTVEDPNHPHHDRYREWARAGWLTVTEGNVIDYDAIERDAAADIQAATIAELAYDPWGATQISQRLAEQTGVTIVEIPQTTRHLSEAMKDLEAAVRSGRLYHDGNPLLAWCFSNVTVREDANENIFPRKETPDAKIDGAVASVMAFGRAYVGESRAYDPALLAAMV